MTFVRAEAQLELSLVRGILQLGLTLSGNQSFNGWKGFAGLMGVILEIP